MQLLINALSDQKLDVCQIGDVWITERPKWQHLHSIFLIPWSGLWDFEAEALNFALIATKSIHYFE
jgi:hypothetical protein